MVVSEVFRSVLFDKAFRGFGYDDERKCVSPRFALELTKQQELIRKFAEFGFKTKEEAQDSINSCLSEDYSFGMLERKERKLAFVSLPVGTVVRLGREYNQTLSLLYLGEYKFLVCEDTENCLRVGDVVQSVEKGMTVNKKAHFWLYDKGMFPSDSRKVYSTGEVLYISWCPSIPRKSTKQNIVERVIRSPKQLYAWKPSLVASKLVFEAREITDNKDALFRINLENNTFGINPEFDKSVLEIKQFDVFKDCLRLVSDDIEYDRNRQVNLENLRNVNNEGYLSFDADEMCFVIETKIKIRL